MPFMSKKELFANLKLLLLHQQFYFIKITSIHINSSLYLANSIKFLKKDLNLGSFLQKNEVFLTHASMCEVRIFELSCPL